MCIRDSSWTQPNPLQNEKFGPKPNPTQSNPTHGLTQPMSISEVRGEGAHSQNIEENHPIGVPRKDAKFFSVTNTTRTFGQLSCTDFEHIWNKRRESVCACLCVNRWKISEFLRRDFIGPPNNWKLILLRGCLWQGYSSNGTILGNGNHFGD